MNIYICIMCIFVYFMLIIELLYIYSFEKEYTKILIKLKRSRHETNLIEEEILNTKWY